VFTFPVGYFGVDGMALTGQEPLGEINSTCVFDLDATHIDSYFHGTLDAAAAVDKGGGNTGFPMTGHNFEAGDFFTIAGAVEATYNATHLIDSVSANEIVVTITFVAETFNGTETARSQLWKNIEPTPDDSELQSAYHVMLGTALANTTDDPIFDGAAGSQAAFWTGTDTEIFDLIGGNTPFLNNLHKADGQNFWIISMWHSTDGAWIDRPLMCTVDIAGDHGVFLTQNPDESHKLEQWSATKGAVYTTDINGSPTGDHVIGYDVDHDAATDTATWWNDSTTGTDIAIEMNNSSTNSSPMRIGFFPGSSAGGITDNMRLYSLAMGTGTLTDGEFAALVAHLELRQNRTVV